MFRYEPSEPLNVTVLEGKPTILNFTLNSKEGLYKQGKSDIDYQQALPLLKRISALYKAVMDYDHQDY